MLIHLAVLAITILLLSLVMPDVRINGLGTAIAVAVVFSVLNFFLGWFLRAVLFVVPDRGGIAAVLSLRRYHLGHGSKLADVRPVHGR